jgi:hypothetical protein
MKLKKNDRVIYADMFKGTLIENPYRNVGEKESYVEVLFDGQEGILNIQVDKLKKIEDEKILTENKFHNLHINNYEGETCINIKADIDPKIDIKEFARKLEEGVRNMNLEFGHKGNKPIQLNTRKEIDNKCYEIMGEKTLYICLEELAELQQAITKFLRDKPNMENIEEEIADVEICLEWVKDIIKPNSNHIEAWKDYKYNRMKTRIEKGEMK